jgi:deoxyribodipyrimidine photo-lyase
MTTLVWFREDLRLEDHPALHSSAQSGKVVAVFLVAARQWASHDLGIHHAGFLGSNLTALAHDLGALGIPLEIVSAPRFRDAPQALFALAQTHGANAVAANEEYPLNERVRDSQVANYLRDRGIRFQLHSGSTILGPGQVLTGTGEPYTVFTPFRRRWTSHLDTNAVRPLPAPDSQGPPVVNALDTAALGLTETPISTQWPAGAAAAAQALAAFTHAAIRRYDRDRDIPSITGTSRLSPYLAQGVLSPRQCLHAALDANQGRLSGGEPGIETWISELVWRDFYRHVIALFPHVSRGEAFRPEADRVPWRNDPAELDAWQSGRTGYPLVDAAMRQLANTGWMHNRLRMVTAMFLTKHLLIDWRLGERHFMSHLVDADFPANNGGWQWSASTGTDAAPYFRVFNPITQAERFDPSGDFVRHYVPELAHTSGAATLTPWRHGVTGYPHPIVDHAFARTRALETYRKAR